MGENRTHPAAAELLKDAAMRNCVSDHVSDHWRESYVREAGKSMKILGLAVTWKNSCCNIALAQVCAFLSLVWRTKAAKLRYGLVSPIAGCHFCGEGFTQAGR